MVKFGESALKLRQRACRAGRRAEMIAVAVLRLKGYRILAPDYRAGVGELDIMAWRGRLLVVIEVKRRRGSNGASHGRRRRTRLGIQDLVSWISVSMLSWWCPIVRQGI